MKRTLCLLLVFLLIFSLGAQAFAEDYIYCRLCGRKIPGDSRVCPYCGEAVVMVEQDNASPQPVVNPDPAPAPNPFSAQPVALSGGHVWVTKSPTSESVPYGGSCMFIAHAVNASSINWYIASADGSLVLPAAEAAANVPGLYVSGYNSDTLMLSGVPSWMNGCQVQACFTGESGPVYSDIARIWTYEETVDEGGGSCYPWWLDWWGWPWWWGYDPMMPPSLGSLSSVPAPPDVEHAITLPNGASIAPDLPGPGWMYPSSTVEHVGHTIEP